MDKNLNFLIILGVCKEGKRLQCSVHFFYLVLSN